MNRILTAFVLHLSWVLLSITGYRNLMGHWNSSNTSFHFFLTEWGWVSLPSKYIFLFLHIYWSTILCLCVCGFYWIFFCVTLSTWKCIFNFYFFFLSRRFLHFWLTRAKLRTSHFFNKPLFSFLFFFLGSLGLFILSLWFLADDALWCIIKCLPSNSTLLFPLEYKMCLVCL